MGGLEYETSEQTKSAANCPAVRLYVREARRVKSSFELDGSSLPAVVAICSEAQGMPLAILLAASWAEVYSPAEILAEMLGSLDFLKAEWAGLPERQRSVRAAFDYSWHLLETDEQALFQALCVFRSPFNREAAAAAAGAEPRHLRRLVDKSFLTPQAGEWYSIHSLLRQYGLERLNAQPGTGREVQSRCSAYFLGLLQQWETGLKSSRQVETLAAMDTRINDLRPAWVWAVGQENIERPEGGLEALCLYYEMRCRFLEGRGLCQEAFGILAGLHSREARRFLARLAVWDSRFLRLLGELQPARQRLEEAQALVDELPAHGLDGRAIQVLIYLEAGELAFTADLPAAREPLEKSVELYQQLGDDWGAAGALYRLGLNRHLAGDHANSNNLLMEALALFRTLGSPGGIANTQRILAYNQVRTGNTESGLSLMRQVIAASQSAGDRAQASLDLRTLGTILMWNGRYDRGIPLLAEALPTARELGSQYEMTFIQAALELAWMMTGQYERARQVHGQVQELARRNGFQREAAASRFALACVALVEQAPKAAQALLQESMAAYRQVDQQEELGWVLSMEAVCWLSLAEAALCRKRLAEAVEIALRIRGYIAALLALSAGALWLGSCQQPEKALELYGSAAAQPIFANSAFFHELFGEALQKSTASLPHELAEAARERGQQRPPWQNLEILRQELLAAEQR